MQSAPLCDVELTLIDSSDIGSTNITLGGSDLGIGVNSVTVMANQLSPSRDYNVICDSSNARGSNTSMTTLREYMYCMGCNISAWQHLPVILLWPRSARSNSRSSDKFRTRLQCVGQICYLSGHK